MIAHGVVTMLNNQIKLGLSVLFGCLARVSPVPLPRCAFGVFVDVSMHSIERLDFLRF